MKTPRWKVEPVWQGETVALLGGGPSLTREQVAAVGWARLQRRCRVIAVNNAYQLAPWADLVYWSDDVWYEWHREHALFRGFSGLKVALANARPWTFDPFIRCLENYGETGLCEIRDGVMTGRSSGYQAVNLAYHLGVKRVLLLGFDMRAVNGRTHWHKDHRRPTPPGDYAAQMLPPWAELGAALAAKGVEVVNCTPGSAIQAFPFATVDCAMEELEDEACLAPGA